MIRIFGVTKEVDIVCAVMYMDLNHTFLSAAHHECDLMIFPVSIKSLS
ncbi:hypothetical protein OROGR_019303 [Orobanche gracilis]